MSRHGRLIRAIQEGRAIARMRSEAAQRAYQKAVWGRAAPLPPRSAAQRVYPHLLPDKATDVPDHASPTQKLDAAACLYPNLTKGR